MRALIVGAGSVGLGVASCLLKSGWQAHLVGRPATGAALAAHGLWRTGLFGECRCPPGSFGTGPDLESAGRSPFDYVLVCAKSYDSEAVAADLARHAHLLAETTRVVLFQNGYGNVEVFSAALSPER
ncbi:MAG: 2-dehydropantoate 2-reductase, partial [Gemmatimonadota bacterium]